MQDASKFSAWSCEGASSFSDTLGPYHRIRMDRIDARTVFRNLASRSSGLSRSPHAVSQVHSWMQRFVDRYADLKQLNSGNSANLRAVPRVAAYGLFSSKGAFDCLQEFRRTFQDCEGGGRTLSVSRRGCARKQDFAVLSEPKMSFAFQLRGHYVRFHASAFVRSPSRSNVAPLSHY